MFLQSFAVKVFSVLLARKNEKRRIDIRMRLYHRIIKNYYDKFTKKHTISGAVTHRPTA
jgi:hypothetical protein